MSQTLQVAPSSGASRGEVAIQPAYFTSSLFVDALRADIRELERIFSRTYHTHLDELVESNGANTRTLEPFILFKQLWSRLGWQWLHLKVLEPRARETLLNAVLRVFLECTEPTESPTMRAVGLFSLYTFYMSQPSTSIPRQLQSARGIPIPVDTLERLLDFPESLNGPQAALKPHAQYILQILRPRFLILPQSELQAQNPSILPREEVRNELGLEEGNGNSKRRKKQGRPSKLEKAQQTRAALVGLDRWLENSSYPLESIPARLDPAGGAGLWHAEDEETLEADPAIAADSTTHFALSQRPIVSLDSYREKKATVVNLLHGSEHADAVDRAGGQVLRRLKEIDAAAAERGLEVGTEGVVRKKIIDSVFNKRNASGEGPLEYYVGHLKIWEVEQVGGGASEKARYIILARTSDNSPLIHKSRLNPNGTFSVGKTWKLEDLRAIEVPQSEATGQPSPEIIVTFARTYTWQTADVDDQIRFLSQVYFLFKETCEPQFRLFISGFDPIPAFRPSARDVESNDLRSVKSTAMINESRSASRTRVPNGTQRSESPIPQTRPRLPLVSSRPMSPAGASSRTASPARGGGTRPSSPALSASGASSRRVRRPSNAASSSARSFEPSSPSQYPSINVSPLSPAPASTSRIKEPSPLRARPIQVQSQTSSHYSPHGSLDVPSISSTAGGGATSSTMSVAMSLSSAASSTGSPISSVPTSELARPSSSNGPRLRSNPATPRAGSPAPSTSSRRSQRDRATTPTTEPPVPLRVAKVGPSAVSMNLQSSQSQPGKRDANARISFFDPANQALLDRLLFAAEATPPSSAANVNPETGEGEDDDVWEGEGDTAAATLSNIEEMLEGYEWLGDGLPSRSRRGPADAIESRLLDELGLLERANIHSLLESDDVRIAKVLAGLDEAIAELDGMDKTVSSYKIHLNAVSDDILYIQSQNRGLQVQIQNQQQLLAELEKLLQTVHVDRETLLILTQESLEKDDGIARLELAATELYKALLAARDNDMAATMERLDEYRMHNNQFCKRVLDFLTIMFTAQSDLLLGDTNGLVSSSDVGSLVVLDHKPLEVYLGRYCGLMLYLREMDETKYSKICAAYFSAASDLHSKQVKALLTAFSKFIRQATEEETEQAFASTEKEGIVSGGLRRAGTVVRAPLDGKKEKEKGKKSGGKLKPFEVLDTVLEQIAPQIFNERAFIADFLLINDAAITFADYMTLEHYFRRQASQYAGLSNTTMKLLRGAMDLIFGFLTTELKAFIDAALAKDNMQIVGVLASLERAIAEAENRGNTFFAGVLDKQHQRLRLIFDRHVDEQIKGVEQTRLDAKKRRGVAHFIKYFPVYVARIESQLGGADGLEIRDSVDVAYDRIVQRMFDCLKQMAKLDGESEDKGQLNYHVILIENMHHFISEISQVNITAVNAFKRRAEAIYDENLGAYVKMVMRRSFAKIIDFFDGVDRMLKTTAPTEVSKNSSYNRSALKRVVKEYDAKDVRKNIDALFKRVEKHFTDTDAPEATTNIKVMSDVWKACEEELFRMTDLFLMHINQCYKDTGVSLEYSKTDVEAAFKRHRVGA
ncbi:hypothetical protein A7U60_g4980 [Sanghuangporus baumii]|uniref:Exocyst complex component Sec3 PIP2-binding N-terminal domain-containing protein n=1 Tax=Sanghuangporus baumii TaxID=108892 RepID=A0A9Q5HXP8_SANBA|nr:hypothetical protein A7U60_g4980 [Sanghuangporus baumii]